MRRMKLSIVAFHILLLVPIILLPSSYAQLCKLIEGTSGNNTLVALDANTCAEIYGFEGDDDIDARLATFARVYGGPGRDIIAGSQGNDYLDGEDGDDVIGANGGSENTIFGGRGNDEIQGGSSSNDFIDGGEGVDTIDAGGGTANTIFGGPGADRIQGGAFSDDFIDGGEGDDLLGGFGGNNVILGGDGADQIEGGIGDDQVDGGADDDILRGEAGNDELLGNSGNDTLDGGSGQDLLVGGPGSDSLTGGEGADTFRWYPDDIDGCVDAVKDFNDGQGDVIDLSSLYGEVDLVNKIEIDPSAMDDGMYLRQSICDEFEIFAELEGVTDLNIDDLVDSGNLILPDATPPLDVCDCFYPCGNFEDKKQAEVCLEMKNGNWKKTQCVSIDSLSLEGLKGATYTCGPCS